MAELFAAETWLYSVLAADASLAAVVGERIYSEQAWQTDPLPAMPIVLFQMLSGNDLRGVGAVRVWVDAVYVVRGISDEDGYGGSLKTIADRIDAVLHAASGSNAEGTVVECVRDRPFKMPETINGRVYRHLGGVYRLHVQ